MVGIIYDNFATFTLYSQIDFCNVRRSCQYLIDFIRWLSKARGRTFFLHSGTNVVKSVCVRVIGLTLLALYECPGAEYVDSRRRDV